MPENAELYECIKCNFKCSKKSNWDKHLLTRKHISDAKKMPENADAYQCESCSKIYRSRGSLWKHTRLCDNNPTTANTKNMYWLNNENAMNAVLQVIKQNQELITSNSHFKELLIGQQHENQKLQTQLIEAVKDTGNTIHNTVNNTTNNNQKFNLNFFLNTTCKDAMNMSEFIENMNINFKDIEKIGFATAQTNDFQQHIEKKPIVLLRWNKLKAKSTIKKDEEKLYEFLKLRASLDTLELIRY